jgi:hypothetical protein
MMEAMVVVLLAADPPSALPERVEFAFQQDVGEQLALGLTGPNARRLAKSDGQGLRLALLPDRSDCSSVGVETRFHVRGDFEITLAYEVLAVDQEAPADGAGVSLWLKFGSPNAGGASVTRLRKGTKEVFGASRIVLGRDGKDHYQTKNVPANSRRGKLRLVRTGPTLRYLVVEEGSEFQEIHTAEVGTEDVTKLRAVATSGGKPATADVRLLAWSIQGDSLPNPPAIRPRAGNGWGWLVWTVGVVLILGLGSATAYYFIPGLRRLPRRSSKPMTHAGPPLKARAATKSRPVSGRQK